jgi:nucleotide-binding universal stress UspA family protein
VTAADVTGSLPTDRGDAPRDGPPQYAVGNEQRTRVCRVREEGLPVERGTVPGGDDTATSSPAAAGADGSRVGRRIVVPVVNPASIPPLMAIASRLATGDQGVVIPVTCIRRHAPADERAHAWQAIAEAEAAGHEHGVAVSGQVLEGDDVAAAVLEAIGDVDASLVVMGWRGRSSTSNVFGSLIDTIVGRSSVPLAIVRLGTTRFRRVLLPVSADHLLPGGNRGLCLAVDLAHRLASTTTEPTTVLRTGVRKVELPEVVGRLGDRVHHDPRRTDQAVAAFARPDDLVVAAVAPTVSGLRAATTHLAWAAPDTTLLVAVDVGRPREPGLAGAVDEAGVPAPVPPRRGERDVRIVVTVRLTAPSPASAEDLDRVLRTAGATDHLMAWWPAGDPHPHVRATVTVRSPSVNAAISTVMVAVHDAPAFRGAEISYDVDRGSPRPTVESHLVVEADRPTPAGRE